jgi:hypothetical protein
MDPFRPFRSKEEYQLARWTVKHRLPKAAINDLTTISGINNVSSATSAYTLFKAIDSIPSDLDVNSWQRKFICFDMERDRKSLPNDQLTPFWYGDPVRCIEFLMQQPSFKEDMVYAPVREYNEAGERMYSEINSSDWWWKMQVCLCSPERLYESS